MNEKNIQFYAAKDIVSVVYNSVTAENVNDRIAFSTMSAEALIDNSNIAKELSDYANDIFWRLVNDENYQVEITDSRLESMVEIAKRNADVYRNQVNEIVNKAKAENDIIAPISYQIFEDNITVDKIKEMALKQAELFLTNEDENNNPIDPNTGQLIISKIPEYANDIFWQFITDDTFTASSAVSELQLIIDIAKKNADSYRQTIEKLKENDIVVPNNSEIDNYETDHSNVEEDIIYTNGNNIKLNECINDLKQELNQYNFNDSFVASSNLINILKKMDKILNNVKYQEELLIPEVKADTIEMSDE